MCWQNAISLNDECKHTNNFFETLICGAPLQAGLYSDSHIIGLGPASSFYLQWTSLQLRAHTNKSQHPTTGASVIKLECTGSDNTNGSGIHNISHMPSSGIKGPTAQAYSCCLCWIVGFMGCSTIRFGKCDTELGIRGVSLLSTFVLHWVIDTYWAYMFSLTGCSYAYHLS